ncbi:MAG: glycoside hydrolase family 15 protein [Patescibacteria group bacterium]
MARSVTIGNGNLLVGLDQRGQVRDFYFPYVGHSNHVSGASGNFVHRIGVFVDGAISWLDDHHWNVTVGCDERAAIGSLFAVNDSIGVSLASRDVVHNERNVFIRQFTITNERDDSREIKLFVSQQFRISESRRGDTGFYDPRVNAIVHYKGRHTFLVNAYKGEHQFTEYNIGLFGIEGKEGTYHDAEDGILERNVIEHGSVDSIIGVTCDLNPQESAQVSYWIACGHSVPEVHQIDAEVLEETPERLIISTEHYWQAWLDKEERDLSPLSEKLQSLYHRSLLTIRAHTDNRGGIIASSDTDMLHHGRDTYSYVWPRDAAIIAHSLDVAGYTDVTQRFFQFMAECLEPDGYLMHKYRVDGVLGSSWHPWMIQGKARLPIQEDETALVVVMLWRHYERNKDIEFIESLYNSFLEPIGQFMVEYIEPTTGLPMPSFDLWEEKYGTSTYTACSVYGALMAIAKFSMLLGKDDDARTYQAIAQRMQTAIKDVLFDDEMGMFVKHVMHTDDGELEYDKTIDSSSFYGPVLFEVFYLDDEVIKRSLATIEDKLQVRSTSKGFVRYEGDGYYTMQDAGSPNPWVVTTLWVAQYYIEIAETIDDLKRPYELLEWTESHSTKAGVLAEQMHPHTREHLSTAPLTWSHAEYVLTVDAYLRKYEALMEEDKD